jgi:hypothetical protein
MTRARLPKPIPTVKPRESAQYIASMNRRFGPIQRRRPIVWGVRAHRRLCG